MRIERATLSVVTLFVTNTQVRYSHRTDLSQCPLCVVDNSRHPWDVSLEPYSNIDNLIDSWAERVQSEPCQYDCIGEKNPLLPVRAS